MASRRAHPQGCDPLSDPDLAGAFPPLWPGAGLNPRAPPTAHIWKEFEGEWGGGSGRTPAGDAECGGQVELGRAWTPVPRARAQIIYTSLIPASSYFYLFTDRETEASTGAEICL